MSPRWAGPELDCAHRPKGPSPRYSRVVIFRKGGVRVDASNSHQDYFTRNLVAVRSELREVLAVYKPQCFGEVTGLN